MLRALTDCTVVIANAYPEKKAGIASTTPRKGRTPHLLVRVYS